MFDLFESLDGWEIVKEIMFVIIVELGVWDLFLLIWYVVLIV